MLKTKNMKLIVKLVIFSIINNKLKVFLYDGKLPSGNIQKGQPLDVSSEKIFKQKLGIKVQNSFLEQLYTTSFTDEIDVVYYVLKNKDSIPAGKISNFFTLNKIPKTTPDDEIVHYALQRLRWKIEYTNAVYSLLPFEFTFTELQQIYEAILGKKLDKRNFRKKIMSLDIINSTGHIKQMGQARPAEMFSFKKRQLAFVRIL